MVSDRFCLHGMRPTEALPTDHHNKQGLGAPALSPAMKTRLRFAWLFNHGVGFGTSMKPMDEFWGHARCQGRAMG